MDIQSEKFRAVYHAPGIYEQVLLPHFFDGVEDVDLVARLMLEHYGQPGNDRRLNVLDLGCGTGRVTTVLAPYAATLYGIDSGGPMIAAFRQRFPDAQAACLDIREAVEAMHAKGLAGTFDVVGAFWSLSYPILDLFEEMTSEGIRPRADAADARRRADGFVRDVLSLVAPNGRLIVMFFDSETPEQRLVTQLWEQIAPFPGTGRGYAREIVIEGLRDAESRGEGRLVHTRRGGVAAAPTPDAARRWFEIVHLKSFPALVSDPTTRAAVERFAREHEQPSGEVLIPSGVHLIDFWKIESRAHVAGSASASLTRRLR
ncbi:class I SAM-dependent methyltransferase [Micromonospora sp. NPDC050695]|uniref:class I SAM-dependent methyltransferase n=1 Tax=Micromonospora sp. NPDC050695 TaxID=3154938 RepID=UPI00340795CE